MVGQVVYGSQSVSVADEVGIRLRANAPSRLRWSRASLPQLPPGTAMVGGIPTFVATRSELADLMVSDFRARIAGEVNGPRVVVSSNGSVIAAFHRDSEFRRSVLQADIVDADGMSLVMATRLLCNAPLKERVATTDFVHDACASAVQNGMKFFFLGGKPGVAEEAAAQLKALYPGLQIVGCRHGYFGKDDEAALCQEIEAAGTDMLWVGLGSPAQERFAISNRHRLTRLSWIRTCGGLFDHYTKGAKRAPGWMQRCGLEWMHRAMREPKRLGPRYLVTNPIAAFHLATKTYD